MNIKELIEQLKEAERRGDDVAIYLPPRSEVEVMGQQASRWNIGEVRRLGHLVEIHFGSPRW